MGAYPRRYRTVRVCMCISEKPPRQIGVDAPSCWRTFWRLGTVSPLLNLAMLSSLLQKAGSSRTAVANISKRSLFKSAAPAARQRLPTLDSWTRNPDLATLRFKPRSAQCFGTCSCRHHEAKPLSSSSSSPSPPDNTTTETDVSPSSTPALSVSSSDQAVVQPDEPKMAIAFTCTADGCGHRQAHVFTKRSYERGIVIITCSSCQNRCASSLLAFRNRDFVY